MKTIVIESAGKVLIKEVPEPQRGAGEVLLKMRYGGICGSDLGSYRGTFAYFSYPRTPGHEFSAEIVEIDRADAERFGLAQGMIVTGNPYFNCGHCYPCQRGFVNCCEDNQTMGVQREGAFSEYFTMPAERLYDGKGLPPRALALIEPFCISYHGASRANIKPGDHVLVVGAGTIGLLAAVAAKSFGADVCLCDVAEQKLKFSAQFGITEYIVNSGGDARFLEQVRQLTGGRGFDVAIEAVGLPSTFQNCIDAAAYQGRVVLIGVGKKNLDFNFTVLQKKELNVFGSRNSLKSDFLALIDFVREQQFDLEKIVTNTYHFSDAPKAFADFDANAGSMLKVLLCFEN